jgi:hypothetical protein
MTLWGKMGGRLGSYAAGGAHHRKHKSKHRVHHLHTVRVVHCVRK